MMEWLFPNHCFLCNEVILPRQRLCNTCRTTADYILPPVCPLCGRGEDICICGKRRHRYERCVSPFYDTGTVKRGISSLKNQGYTVTVDGFAAEMAEVVRREYGGISFDLITGVPLHPADRRKRGFDQAALLGQALSRHSGVPYQTVLKKLYRTRPQKELTALERSGNLLGAFDVLHPELVAERTVLLVDDVVTTGATLDECAKMLKICGAARIYAVTAAAAVLKKSENGV